MVDLEKERKKFKMTYAVHKQTKVWTTREGKKIRLCDMTDDHLVNTLNFLVRTAKEKRADAIVSGWCFLNSLQGKTAIEACEGQVDRVEESDWYDWTPVIFENMKEEYQRRFGKTFEPDNGEEI